MDKNHMYIFYIYKYIFPALLLHEKKTTQKSHKFNTHFEQMIHKTFNQSIHSNRSKYLAATWEAIQWYCKNFNEILTLISWLKSLLLFFLVAVANNLFVWLYFVHPTNFVGLLNAIFYLFSILFPFFIV